MCHSSTQFQDVPGSGIFGRSVSWTSIPCLRHGDFRIFQTKRPSLKGFSAGAIRGLVAWRLYNVVCSRRSEAVTISEGNGLAITCYPSALAAHKKIRKQHENSKQQVATARETMARSSSNLLVGEEGKSRQAQACWFSTRHIILKVCTWTTGTILFFPVLLSTVQCYVHSAAEWFGIACDRTSSFMLLAQRCYLHLWELCCIPRNSSHIADQRCPLWLCVWCLCPSGRPAVCLFVHIYCIYIYMCVWLYNYIYISVCVQIHAAWICINQSSIQVYVCMSARARSCGLTRLGSYGLHFAPGLWCWDDVIHHNMKR